MQCLNDTKLIFAGSINLDSFSCGCTGTRSSGIASEQPNNTCHVKILLTLLSKKEVALKYISQENNFILNQANVLKTMQLWYYIMQSLIVRQIVMKLLLHMQFHLELVLQGLVSIALQVAKKFIL